MKTVFYERHFQLFLQFVYKENNLQVYNRNISKFGNKSLRILWTYIWNSPPENITPSTSIYKFK